MKAFMDKDFLLQTETAKKLYHEHAEKMPIIDYHCHLIPQMVAENKRFESIAQIWLMGDHYKWRAMRSNGVDERFCTGKDTSDWENRSLHLPQPTLPLDSPRVENCFWNH